MIFHKTYFLYFSLLNRTFKKPVCSVFTCKEFVWKSGQVCMCNVFCILFLFDWVFFCYSEWVVWYFELLFLIYRAEKKTSLIFIVSISTFDWNTTLKIMYELLLSWERLNHKCKVQSDILRYYLDKLALFIRKDVFCWKKKHAHYVQSNPYWACWRGGVGSRKQMLFLTCYIYHSLSLLLLLLAHLCRRLKWIFLKKNIKSILSVVVVDINVLHFLLL